MLLLWITQLTICWCSRDTTLKHHCDKSWPYVFTSGWQGPGDSDLYALLCLKVLSFDYTGKESKWAWVTGESTVGYLFSRLVPIDYIKAPWRISILCKVEETFLFLSFWGRSRHHCAICELIRLQHSWMQFLFVSLIFFLIYTKEEVFPTPRDEMWAGS